MASVWTVQKAKAKFQYDRLEWTVQGVKGYNGVASRESCVQTQI